MGWKNPSITALVGQEEWGAPLHPYYVVYTLAAQCSGLVPRPGNQITMLKLWLCPFLAV